MKKIMFDTNIFDKLGTFIGDIKNTTNNFEYYVTTIQIEESCEIPDSKIETRKINILRLAELRAKMVPISVFVLNGRSRLGYARLGEGVVYKSILKENGSNADDAIIADTAVFEGCTLITDDKELYTKMKSQQYDVMSLSEFLNSLRSHK